MKKTITLLLPLCIGAFILMAADTKAPVPEVDRPRQLTDRFMATIIANQSVATFGIFLRGCWYKPAEAVGEATTLNGTYLEASKALEKEIGKQLPGGYEFLGRRRMGTSFVTYVYVEKHEDGLWPWSFTFYKAQNEWKLRVLAFGTSAWDDMMAMSVPEPAK